MHFSTTSTLLTTLTFLTSIALSAPASNVTSVPIIIPVSSTASPSPTATPAARYAQGWCTFHLDFYVPTQGEWDSGTPYKISIPNLFDNAHNKIGSYPVTGIDDVTLAVDSALPLALLVRSSIDQTGVLNFAYGNTYWNSSSSNCDGLGGNSGHGFGTAVRQLDCGFTC